MSTNPLYEGFDSNENGAKEKGRAFSTISPNPIYDGVDEPSNGQEDGGKNTWQVKQSNAFMHHTNFSGDAAGTVVVHVSLTTVTRVQLLLHAVI